MCQHMFIRDIDCSNIEILKHIVIFQTPIGIDLKYMLVAMSSGGVLVASSFSLPRQFQCYHNQTILQSHYVTFFFVILFKYQVDILKI